MLAHNLADAYEIQLRDYAFIMSKYQADSLSALAISDSFPGNVVLGSKCEKCHELKISVLSLTCSLRLKIIVMLILRGHNLLHYVMELVMNTELQALT